MAENLQSGINSTAGYTAVVNKYVVSVTKDDGSDFELTIDDDRSGDLANAFTNTVQSLASLPVIAPNDYTVEVESDPSTTIDNRWLKFKTFNDETFDEGAWQETVKPGISYKLDPNTMPSWSFTEQRKMCSSLAPLMEQQKHRLLTGQIMSTRSRSGQAEQQEMRSHHQTLSLLAARSRSFMFRSRYVVAAAETFSSARPMTSSISSMTRRSLYKRQIHSGYVAPANAAHRLNG